LEREPTGFSGFRNLGTRIAMWIPGFLEPYGFSFPGTQEPTPSFV
jgi:hypothetical protein